MKQSLLIVLAVFFTFSFAEAQRVLADFETQTPAIGDCFGNGSQGNTCFSIVANPDATGVNMSDSVGQYIEPAEGETWMGMFMDLTNLHNDMIVLSSGQTQLCADVWTATSVPFTFKLEKLANGGAIMDHEGGQIIPANTSQWETVCDDFAGTSFDGDTAHRLVIFFNIGAVPATNQTYYVDNITQMGVVNTTSINDLEVGIFPNPATHNLHFRTDGQPLTIVVSDMMGREVARYHEYAQNNIRVSDYQSGTYVITFIDETTGGIATSKFVKK